MIKAHLKHKEDHQVAHIAEKIEKDGGSRNNCEGKYQEKRSKKLNKHNNQKLKKFLKLLKKGNMKS